MAKRVIILIYHVVQKVNRLFSGKYLYRSVTNLFRIKGDTFLYNNGLSFMEDITKKNNFWCVFMVHRV